MINNNIYHLLIVLLLSFGSVGCSQDDDPSQGPVVTPTDYLQINLDTNLGFQTIHGFGASDAWSTQFVGKYWPLNKKEQIADYLFSTVMDAQGNPKGIGLNTWRFNIGGGSSYQGGSSGINDEWRRAECFLTSNGYNWDAHEGQRWFLQAAKQRGANKFIGFSNSPPVVLTKNNKAHSSGGSSANIASENYDAYATFLAEVAKNIQEKEGINFDYISPFNEPQWDWTGGQEGSPWLNTEVAAITRLLDSKIKAYGLNSKIEIAEAGQLNYLYEDGNRPGRANQIQDFFNSSSSNYIGDLDHLAHKIAGHSYYTTWNTSRLIDVRNKVNSEINKVDNSLEFWMTEYCLLEDNSEVKGGGRDLGIDPALYLARVIHTDLTVANANSWQWWIAVSPYDYKDGLVYIDYSKNNGNVYESKLLWTLGNYSRFIKEGYRRINVTRSDNKAIEQSINGVLVSAYKDPGSSKKVVVVVNQKSIDIPVKIASNDADVYSGKMYQTSGMKDDNLAYKKDISEVSVIDIPARSIVTFVID